MRCAVRWQRQHRAAPPAEWRISGTPVRLIGGVNNVFDEDYYSRVRPDGIDPAPRRNFYLGAALEF